jgi:hypothetical protein
MFTYLPEEIERIIWKFYFTGNVVKEVKKINSIWVSPSDEIINMCSDKGCAQITHTDMDRVLFMNPTPHTDVVHQECFKNICANCVYHGFPCMNASFYGGFDDRLMQFWDTEHYLNDTNFD